MQFKRSLGLALAAFLFLGTGGLRADEGMAEKREERVEKRHERQEKRLDRRHDRREKRLDKRHERIEKLKEKRADDAK